MARVITYGTYDLFHVGHLRLLQRAKELAGEGGKLIVGVSTDRFNWEEKHKRSTIPYEQRAEIIAALKCVDEVIPEDDWDMKRDIIEKKIDIFCMGGDWEGKFDFLKEVCEVVYFPRTEGISSTELKAEIKDGKGGAK